AQRRGGHAEDQVGAGAIRDDAVPRALQQPGDQSRGGRLAVCPGDHDRALGQVLGQARQDPGVDRAGDVAGQRGAAAAPCDPAQGAGGLPRPDGGGFPYSHASMERVTTVHSAIPLIALAASSSDAHRLKNAEPLPVICQSLPRRLAKSTRPGSTRSAARLSWFGPSPFTSSHASYTAAVESSKPGQTTANHAGSCFSGVSCSPRPSARAEPPRRKKVTSAPSSRAIGWRSTSRRYSHFSARSAVAASELAPPMPDPGGMRLCRWISAGSDRPAACSSACWALSTELSFLPTFRPETVSSVTFAGETSSRSWRSIA